MRVNLTRLEGHKKFQDLKDIVDSIISEAKENRDPIYISDLLLEPNRSAYLIETLRKTRDRIYKLHVLKDKWGQPVKPGDVVYREHKKSLFESPDKPISASKLSAIVKGGKWEKSMIDYEEFRVDKKNCIECTADDVFYFITHFGIHGDSKQRMSFHPNETSEGPVRLDDKPGMKHVWYWRYEEVDKEMYSMLPDMTQSVEKEIRNAPQHGK